MNIVFFGSDNFAVKPLEALIKAGVRISCVVTQPDREKGRGLKLEGTPVKAAARKAGLKIYQPINVNSKDTLDFLKKLNPDLFIIIAYGQLFSQDILDLPKIFSVNAHASLLPKYRGAAPINWAIIKGESITGVTIMKVTREMDAGPVILERKITILDEDTAISLQDKLSVLAAQLLLEALTQIKNNSFKISPQDEGMVSYAPKMRKSDGKINWSQSGREICNLIRGCFDWPGAFTYYRGRILKIYRAMSTRAPFDCAQGKPEHQSALRLRSGQARASAGQIIEVSKEGISVATGKDVLVIKELQLEGKRKMTAEEFISGHKICVGEGLGGKN